MGIILSFLFPRLYMTTDNSSLSASSSSSRSSSSRQRVPLSPTSDAPSSPFAELPPSPVLPGSFLQSPPLETPSYSPHAIGLGIVSPLPVFGTPGALAHVPAPQRPHSASPTSLRSSSYGPSGSGNSADMSILDALPSDDIQPPQMVPALSYIQPTTNAVTAHSIVGVGQASGTHGGLHIDFLPPDLTSFTSTASPPLLPLPSSEMFPSTSASLHQPQSPSAQAVYFNPDDTTFPLGVDMLSHPDVHLDFTEFDAEGLSALEKIYLFSRSLAGFHRVFIVHALPKYLGADDAENVTLANHEEADRVSPAEAVEYVLPLLNGLAADEDELVKEALAAELVPIIWWFITHCRLVDYELTVPSAYQHADAALPPPVDVTLISVQSFTPILGTLLLSQNALIGGPARQAVVELLKRMWHANERAEGRTPPPPPEYEPARNAYEVGLLGAHERRLFEHEIIHNVIIEMGRLDMPETDEGMLSTISTPRSVGGHEHHEHGEHHHHRSGSHDLAYPMHTSPVSVPDTSTAGSTPLAPPSGIAPDSYFPVMPSPHHVPSALPSLPSGIDIAERVQMQRLVTPPAFSLGQLPPSPPAKSEVSMSIRSVQASRATAELAPGTSGSLQPTSSFAQFEPSSTQLTSPSLSNSKTPTQTPLPLSDVVRAPAPTPSSSESSLSTPSLTSSSSTSSSTSPTGSPESLYASSSTVTPTGANMISMQATLGKGAVDVEMEDQAQGDVIMSENWASGSPKTTVSGLRIDLNDTLSQSAFGHAEVHSRPQEGVHTPVSAWLSAGIPEGDVSMQDVSGTMHEGEGVTEEEDDISEEAAVGRLSSMSLMAAVTASGVLKEETKLAFVGEVERVGRDPIYWVRREAAFALGALAKVVPDELVISSLLPLFETLYQDSTWHVRHSVLFALPAILSRLPPNHRRSLALDVMLPLAFDESPTVRSAVLEALGEVMYTFIDDEGGPPRELLNIFLGIRKDSGAGRMSPKIDWPQRPSSAFPISASASESGDSNASNAGTDIYDDPGRPLVCAFNYPAVALTLGRTRWPELRDLYRSLSQNPSSSVRRTLAASLGEMAKIVGPQYAKEDLMAVWWASIGADEPEVRLKAVECAVTFVRALAESERAEVVESIEVEYSARLKGWREREEVIKSLPDFLGISGIEPRIFRNLLMAALEDRVSAIREVAISVLPAFVSAWKSTQFIGELSEDLRTLAHSESYRQRTTFVTCEQALLLSDHRDVVLLDEYFWETMSTLSRDSVVDVRIRVARLLEIIAENHVSDEGSIMARVLAVAERLEQDGSQDVRAFAHAIRARSEHDTPTGRPALVKSATTFSRPPPPPPS